MIIFMCYLWTIKNFCYLFRKNGLKGRKLFNFAAYMYLEVIFNIRVNGWLLITANSAIF